MLQGPSDDSARVVAAAAGRRRRRGSLARAGRFAPESPRDARRVPVLRERGRRKRKAPAGRRVRRCVRGSREGAVRAPGGGSEGAGRDRVNGDYERDREMRRWNTRKYREKEIKEKRWKKKKSEKDNTMYLTKWLKNQICIRSS